MKKLIFILFLFFSVLCSGQIQGVKHIEIVSDICDTMILINKQDADKINRMYFEKNKIESINKINEEAIKLYTQKEASLVKIIDLKDSIIKDKDQLISETKTSLEGKYEAQKQETKKMRTKKIIWQSISLAEIGIFLLIIL